MKLIRTLSFILLTTTLISCLSKNSNPNTETQQATIVGGGCDGCEMMYQGLPKNLNATDSSAGWQEAGQKLVIEGTVYQPDGKTKAPSIVIYYWQTDNNGLYSKTKAENTIHGHLRGWLQSDANGNYKIYTVRPVSYPKSTIPAHVHFSIKEPNLNEYYIDDLLFEDDPFLTAVERQKLEQRGGNGIAQIQTLNNVQYVRRDIVLGQNIPGYPKP